MEQDTKLTWEALEYEDKERTKDWFWALGVVIIAGSLASIIWGNYFFATLLVISGILLGFFAKKKPRTIEYELNHLGLKIGSELYAYQHLKSFHLQATPDPVLFIKTERIFMPIIGVPIHEDSIETIEQIMQHYEVKEERMTEHPSERIMDFLGF